MANTNPLGTIQIPDDDTLKRLLGTYQAPTVVSGGGPLGTIAQAKLGASTAQPTLPDLAASHGLELQTQDPMPMPDRQSILGTVAAPTRASQDLTASENKLQADTPTPYDYKAHGTFGNIGHVLGRIGNIAGDFLDPEATSLIPHSDLFNARRLAGDAADVQQKTENVAAEKKEQDLVDNEQANRNQRQSEFDTEAPERDSRVAQANAETAKAVQDTADLKLNNQPLTVDNVKRLNDVWTPVLKNAGITAPMFTEGMSPTEVQRSVQALEHVSDMQDKNRNFQEQVAARKQMVADAAAGRNQAHSDAVAAREGDTGRKVLDKAEGQYRTANQGANDLEDTVALAKAGNKVAYSVDPLTGALLITTSQGVKRINRNEIEQFGNAGSLYDRLVGEVGKLKTGKSIPDNILNDQLALAQTMRKNAYQTYSDTFDSAQKRYGLNNETKLPTPGGNSTPQYSVGQKITIKGQPRTITAVHPDGSFDAK